MACGSAEPPSDADPLAPVAAAPVPETVEFRSVETAALRAPIAASGSIEAQRTSEIGAEVSGRIVEVAVDFGDWVEADALLFRIDPAPFEAALAEARAGLAVARADSKNAARQEERARELAHKQMASEQIYEGLRTQAEMARARVQQMQARAARAERDLDRTQVRAPYAGSVVERRAHEGALAGSEPVIVLQESGVLLAVLNVPGATLVPVRVGDPVHVFGEGWDEPIEVEVTRVSDRLDPDTRTYEVRAALPAASAKAGSYVRAEVLPGRVTPRPVVSEDSVRSIDGRTYAFRLAEGGAVERVQVRLGIASGGRVEVLSGLSAGDRVAVGDIVQRLSDGAAVRPRALGANVAENPATSGAP